MNSSVILRVPPDAKSCPPRTRNRRQKAISGNVTMLMYVNGAPDLSTRYLRGIASMEQAQIPEDLSVIVQFSNKPSLLARLFGQWKGTRCYKITTQKHATKERYEIKSECLQSSRKARALTRNAVADFLTRNMTAYPAKHFMFVYKGHASGSSKLGGFFRAGLPVPQLTEAMSKAEKVTGRRIGVTVLDACHVGNAKTAGDLRAVTDFLIASPRSPYADEFPYEAVLGSPEVVAAGSAKELATSAFREANKVTDEFVLYDLKRASS